MDFKKSFCTGDIILPKDCDLEKWAVIACDQHTSDVEYWDEVEKRVGGSPSSYNMIMPEAYLGTDKEKIHMFKIPCQMKAIAEGGEDIYPSSLVYVKRELKGHGTRYGIVGTIDLENYGYDGKTYPVMPTEGTVIERIPPRVEIRRKAIYEMPHIMVFVNDPSNAFFETARRNAEKTSKLLYSFDLMQDGGHIEGWQICGSEADNTVNFAAELEKAAVENGSVFYAIGDGNHSLAAAKALWEELKKQGAPENSPARYALAELVSITDPSIEFEPIYRFIKGINPADFISEFTDTMSAQNQNTSPAEVELITGGRTIKANIQLENNSLAVGKTQDFIDSYIEIHGGSCDYIHGKDTLRSLSENPDSVGILFDGMDKSELFPYISKHGVLPRKTFSMGDASTKRYYIEMRRIKQNSNS